MPVLDAENEVVDIVNNAIESGEISAFEEVEVKIYGSDFDFTNPSKPVLIGDKKVLIRNIINDYYLNDKLVFCKALFPILEVNGYDLSFLISGCAWVGDNVIDANYFFFGKESCFVSLIDDFNNVLLVAKQDIISDDDFNTALFTLLMTYPSQYVSLKFRVEK